MKPLERRIFDKLLNSQGLGKRKIHKPFQTYTDTPQLFTTRFYSMILFPQTKLEEVVSDIFERCLPGFSYFTHKVPMKYLREQGYTLQESLYFNFFRWENFYYHAFAQNLHPFGYLERQRSDAFIRRVNTILPGIKAPDWAQNWRRAPDFDFESIENWQKVLKDSLRDSTPMPHANYPIYFSVGHYLNLRYQLGWYSQRFFYNEKLRGDYFHTGYFTKNDLEVMDSFYAGTSKDSLNHLKDKNIPREKLQEKKKNISKWIKLISEYYPEFTKIKINPRPVKVDEAFFQRSTQHIRDYILAFKWTECLEKGTFNQNEIQQIYEFFLHENTQHFWILNEEDGKYHPTDLYNKFTNELGLPSIFSINKFTAKPAELQYSDLFDVQNHISPYTVDKFRGLYSRHFQESKSLPKEYKNDIRKLISEEVYNPLFAKLVKTHFKLDSNKGSLVIAAINGDYSKLDALNKLHSHAKDQLHFLWDSEVKSSFTKRMKEVVKTFSFVPVNAETH